MTQQEFQQRYQYNTTTDRLGEGGFGKVFKAYDTYLDRWVAIKIAPVLPHLESVRLKKEVELISKLPAHPNIARYEECYTFKSFDGEYDFGILQYYEEGNLNQLLKKITLTYQQKEHLLTQILSGIDFLHNNGIIHRDLKPQNILIVKRGDSYIPKITDFGISKKLDINKSSVFSNSIAGAGTLAYASPEQLAERTIRKNADLWSLGVIAFQVLTNELPFNTGEHGNTSEAGRQELFRQINSGTLPWAINLIKEPWQSLILKCLVTDTEKRVRNCAACVAILKGESNADDDTFIEPTPPEPKPEPEPKPQPTPRNLKPLWFGLGGAVFMVLLFFLLKGTKDNGLTVTQQTEVAADSIVVAWESEIVPEKEDKDTEKISLPVLSALTITNITENSATVTGSITNTGNGTITERGVCYGTSKTPTIQKNSLLRATGTGNKISLSLPDLREGATYYARAYAINEEGVAYSKERSFTTTKPQVAQATTPANTTSTQQVTTSTPVQEQTTPAINIEMVYVAGGTFTMGCTYEQGDDCDNDEKPAHQVTLSSFNIGKYEVTQAQWKQVMGSNPSSFKGDNLPVENVSWNDVQEFIRKLNALTGKRYRLPTEAEWEFAARGGNQSRGYKYSGSNTIGNVAWYYDNSGSKTHPVGTKSANELGIYDMSGNVWEWCSDWYGAYSSSAQTNPKGPTTGSGRVFRGGSWDNNAGGCRVSDRRYLTPGYSYYVLGIRLTL